MRIENGTAPGVPGDGYHDTNDRDITAKQAEETADSEAFSDETVEPDAVKVLPGTGGPDDTGDEEVPADYDPSGHATPARSTDPGAP